MRKIVAGLSALLIASASLPALSATPTTNYGWNKPTVGADSNNWGTFINGDLDGIDTTMFSVSGVANAACPKAGCVYTGNIVVPGASINGAVGTNRVLTFSTSGTSRWDFLANSAGEPGSNGGSDLGVRRYSDAGVLLDAPIVITRSTGLVAIADGLSVTGALTVTGGITGALTGNVTGNVSGSSGSATGNAATASKWQAARTQNCGGDLSGSVSVDGSGDWTLSCTVTAASTSTAGKVALATGAQVITGTDTTHAVTPASLTSQASFSSGFMTWPGGILQEWGHTATLGGSSSTVVTLPRTCPTNAPTLLLVSADNGGTNGGHGTVNSTSQITVGNDKSGSSGYWWYVICN